MPILQSNIHNLFITWVVQKLRRQVGWIAISASLTGLSNIHVYMLK